MTFADARERHLAELTGEFDAIRKIAADPAWCNDNYPAYKDAVKEFLSRLDVIRQLNEAEMEAQQ